MLCRRALIGIAAGILISSFAFGQDRSIVVASTTSTEDSGLFEHIMPLFKEKTGIDVKVIALGTGQALDAARRGDVDVVFVHAKSAEEEFLVEGFGVKRYPVMYNDFILVGPKNDPAGVKGSKDILAAFRAIKDKRVPFISRGDRSGTHLSFGSWRGSTSRPRRIPGTRTFGQGMGAALNTASATDSYLLSDRGTWLSFKNKGDLVIELEGDKHLFNQYGSCS
jgi:tungstate transport system substrate-binding protein